MLIQLRQTKISFSLAECEKLHLPFPVGNNYYFSRTNTIDLFDIPRTTLPRMTKTESLPVFYIKRN